MRQVFIGMLFAITAIGLFHRHARSQAANPPSFVEITWEWISFTSPVEQLNVGSPERYTIKFDREGRVNLRADCNRGAGTYTFGRDRSIKFGPMAVTRAMCPPGSLSDRFVKELSRVSNFLIKGGELYLELPVDSGWLGFRRGAS
jgi:para-nitrobenzyl esterase